MTRPPSITGVARGAPAPAGTPSRSRTDALPWRRSVQWRCPQDPTRPRRRRARPWRTLQRESRAPGAPGNILPVALRSLEHLEATPTPCSRRAAAPHPRAAEADTRRPPAFTRPATSSENAPSKATDRDREVGQAHEPSVPHPEACEDPLEFSRLHRSRSGAPSRALRGRRIACHHRRRTRSSHPVARRQSLVLEHEQGRGARRGVERDSRQRTDVDRAPLRSSVEPREQRLALGKGVVVGGSVEPRAAPA